MPKDTCVLCGEYVSLWQIEYGKTIVIRDKRVHTACTKMFTPLQIWEKLDDLPLVQSRNRKES